MDTVKGIGGASLGSKNLPRQRYVHDIVKDFPSDSMIHLVGGPFTDVPLDDAHRDSLTKANPPTAQNTTTK